MDCALWLMLWVSRGTSGVEEAPKADPFRSGHGLHHPGNSGLGGEEVQSLIRRPARSVARTTLAGVSSIFPLPLDDSSTDPPAPVACTRSSGPPTRLTTLGDTAPEVAASRSSRPPSLLGCPSSSPSSLRLCCSLWRLTTSTSRLISTSPPALGWWRRRQSGHRRRGWISQIVSPRRSSSLSRPS